MLGPHSLDKIKNQKLENDWLQVPRERIFWDKSVDLYTSLVSSSCNGQLVLSHPSKLQHVGMLARIFLYSLSGFKDCLVCSEHLSRSTIYDSWPRHSLRKNLCLLYSQRCPGETPLFECSMQSFKNWSGRISRYSANRGTEAGGVWISR